MSPGALVERLNGFLRRLPEKAVWLAGLIPLAWLIIMALQGGLGVDPVRRIEQDLGKTGLWFLIACLAIPPLRALSGITLLRQRRAVGLLAFFYISLHLLSWIWLEMGFYWSQAISDLWTRPYLFFGISAFLLLIPLALTSHQAAIRRLGRRWRQLHLLIWPASVLGVLHYLWQMKIITTEGWIWFFVLLVLLGWRLSKARGGAKSPKSKTGRAARL